VTKINVNYASISFSFTIRSSVEDLDGNKRTNKKQSSDQEFENYNFALRVSCLKIQFEFSDMIYSSYNIGMLISQPNHKTFI